MRTIVAMLALVMLSACGGRVAQPVSVVTALDAQLSCSHIRGELERNILRLGELRGESDDKALDNLGMLLVSPIFLDVSNTQSVEGAAITERNARLADLAAERECGDISFERPTEDR